MKEVVYNITTGHTYERDYVPSPEPAQPDQTMPTLTARQLRLGLLDYLDQVEQIIANSDDRALQIEWEYATEFERNHPAIVSIGEAIGLTPEQIDAMWINAANT